MRAPALTGRSAGRAPLPLLAGFALFLGLLGYLVLSSVARRAAPAFEPSPPGRVLGDPSGLGPDTLTLDARDDAEWRYADLDLGLVLPAGDSTGWDLAARRFHVRAITPPRGGPDGARRLTGDFGRWYRYGALSHLLRPAGHRYEVVTDRGRPIQVEILSYYCPGLEAGCLTVRYSRLPDRSTHR